MYKVTFTDNPEYTGVYLTVPFAHGVGYTMDDYLAERFTEKGLLVEQQSVEKHPDPADKPKRTRKESDGSPGNV